MNTFDTLLQEIFKLKESDLSDDLTAADIPNWDSMNYLLFISELEKKFNTSFTMDEVLGVKTLGDVRNLLKSRGVEL